MNDRPATTGPADQHLMDLLAEDAPHDPSFASAVTAKIRREELKRKAVLASAVVLGGVASLWGLSDFIVVGLPAAQIEIAAALGLLALALPWAVLEFD